MALSAFAERNRALAAKLGTITTVGEAWLFGMQASADGLVALAELKKSTGIEESAAERIIADVQRDLMRYLGPMKGETGAPVPAATWKDLKGAIGRMYSALWAVEEVLPPQVRHTAWQSWGEIMGDILGAVPQAAAATIDYAGNLAADTIGAGANAASNILGKFIKGAWPILLAAAVILGAGVYLATTGVAIPKVKVST